MIYQRIKTGFIVAAAGAALSVAAASSAAAQDCPRWQLNGVPIIMNAQALTAPQSYPTYAGGVMDLRQCGEVPGVGYITDAPSFSVSYDAGALGQDLLFRVESECDTTLLINTASAGWEFNDDDTSFNPGIRLSQAPSGRYDVWVGTYSEQSCPATLIAQSAGAPPPATCPDWSLGGTQITNAAGQNTSHPVTAGGSINMFENRCNIDAHGYVSQAPNFSMQFDPMGQSSTLTITASGDCDETLLINTPTTAWLFNDDDGDLHPGITIPNATAGRYDIWVGTYGANTCSSVMSVSSTGSAAQPTTPTAPSK